MRKTALVLGIVVATAVAAGIALATTTGVEIKACYDKQSGQMRIYDAGLGSTKACGTKEHSISWNQIGQRGPAGPAGADGQTGAQGLQGARPAGDDGQDGAQGAQGPQGPAGDDGQDGQDGERGPSEAFTVFSSVDTTLRSGDNAVVASLTLEDGSFLLTGLRAGRRQPAVRLGRLGTCRLRARRLGGSDRLVRLPEQHQAIFSFTGVTTLTAPGTVGIRCRNDGPDDVIVRFARASAVQVGTLTVQP